MGLDTRAARVLAGARILVVEDEPLVALDIENVLCAEGAEVVGPSYTVGEAQELVRYETLTAAVLDVEIGSDSVTSVAQALFARGVPFLFHTGKANTDVLRREWPGCEIVSKPTSAWALVAAVASLTKRR